LRLSPVKVRTAKKQEWVVLKKRMPLNPGVIDTTNYLDIRKRVAKSSERKDVVGREMKPTAAFQKKRAEGEKSASWLGGGGVSEKLWG